MLQSKLVFKKKCFVLRSAIGGKKLTFQNLFLFYWFTIVEQVRFKFQQMKEDLVSILKAPCPEAKSTINASFAFFQQATW